MQTQHTLSGPEKTDEALLLAVRDGNLESFGELYERYMPMARAIAFKHTSDTARVDDIVSEAFARILQALKKGKGPHSYMGGYLSTTIAHLAGEYGMLSTREIPSEQEHLESMGSLDETVVKLHESDEIISAFTSLPERWQTVLWLTEIESKKPREVAAAMSLSPNAVSALAIRAKESLKEGFLRAHQNAPATQDCNRFHSHISPYVRGSLSQKRSDALRSHMETCNYCTSEYLSLVGINKSMRSWVFPVLAGLSIWGTDGATLLAPAALAKTGIAGVATIGATANNGFAPGSATGFSLVSPRSWGSGGQLVAGAAAITAATVAIVGGATLSNTAQDTETHAGSPQQSSQGTDTSQSSSRYTETTQNHEKATALGSEYSQTNRNFTSNSRSEDSSALSSYNLDGSGAELSYGSVLGKSDHSSEINDYLDSSASGSSESQLSEQLDISLPIGDDSTSGYRANSDSAVSDSGSSAQAVENQWNQSGENNNISGSQTDNTGLENGANGTQYTAPESNGSANDSSDNAITDNTGETTQTENLANETDSGNIEPNQGINLGGGSGETQPADEATTPATDPVVPATEPTKATEPDTPINPADEATTPATDPVVPATEPTKATEPEASDDQLDGKVPEWYGTSDYQNWFKSVDWNAIAKQDRGGGYNKLCFVSYIDQGGTYRVDTMIWLPDSLLSNRAYAKYALAGYFGWKETVTIACV